MESSLNTRGLCTARGMTMKIFLTILWNWLCLNLFSQGEWKCLTEPMDSSCMVDWGVIFSTSELLYPYTINRLRLIRAGRNFYMISDNPNVSLGIVDCSLYTRRIVLKDHYHKKRMDMLAYTPVEFDNLETVAKTSIVPARQNQFIQVNNVNLAAVCRLAIAMKRTSAFTGLYTKNLFWYQPFWSQTKQSTQRWSANCRFWCCR